MVKIRFEEYKPDNCSRNILYRINESGIIRFTEEHEQHKEIVHLHIQLENGQYAVYANEYRNPLVEKRGCKTADVLILIVDEQKKRIFSFLFDVKTNISAFSDNLLGENAMVTALKEVRDFLEQLEDTLISKNALIALYGNCSEKENLGIVTRNFDSAKFEAVAEMYEKIFQENHAANPLILYKLRNNLKPYGNIIERVKQFAMKKIAISGKTYQLHTYILEKENGNNNAEISSDTSACQNEHADENIKKEIYSADIYLSIEDVGSTPPPPPLPST